MSDKVVIIECLVRDPAHEGKIGYSSGIGAAGYIGVKFKESQDRVSCWAKQVEPYKT